MGDFDFFAEEPLILWCFLLLEFGLKSSPAGFFKNIPEDLHGTLGRGNQATKMGQIHEVQLQDLEYLELNDFGNPRWPACKILT